jgi:hypothetical protein
MRDQLYQNFSLPSLNLLVAPLIGGAKSAKKNLELVGLQLTAYHPQTKNLFSFCSNS